MQKLKPCPACGALNPGREEFKGALWIECQVCGMRGPTVDDMWEYVENVWNALPRRPAGKPNDTLCAGCPCRATEEQVKAQQ